MADILFQPLGNPVTGLPGLGTIADIDPRLTRTHYFDGRLLTAEDLTRDQIYLDQRLREVGRVLGSGIVRGLTLTLDAFAGELALEPGTAVTPAGRVLDLGRRLSVTLSDRALISQLNDGRYRRFDRGLYAVVLRHVEIGTDRAEVFPTDLGAKRGAQVALISEAVQLGLVPLPTPLAEQSPLQLRARLIRAFLGDGQVRALIPEDAVPLGVIAIRDDRPAWLDAELLRHPLRSEAAQGELQADLARHYEALLADLLAFRASGGLGDDFAAAEHFSLLPPVGSLPAGTVDPVGGRQGFFPEHFQVSIAPVRVSDLAQLRAESVLLPAIDLAQREPVNIMVLAPLTAVDYGHYALQLERRNGDDPRLLERIDPLRLRRHPLRPVHVLDTDASVWREIGERVVDGRFLFVRRPTRAAESGLSAIVLALGATLPPPASAPSSATTPVQPQPVTAPSTGDGSSGTTSGGATASPGTVSPTVIAGSLTRPSSPADRGGLIEDEDAVFLRRLGFARLTGIRPPSSRDAESARRALLDSHGADAAVMHDCLAVMLFVERRFDAVIWQTLSGLAEAGTLGRFRAGLVVGEDGAATVEQVVELGREAGLDRALLEQWIALAR